MKRFFIVPPLHFLSVKTKKNGIRIAWLGSLFNCTKNPNHTIHCQRASYFKSKFLFLVLRRKRQRSGLERCSVQSRSFTEHARPHCYKCDQAQRGLESSYKTFSFLFSPTHIPPFCMSSTEMRF